ncbi:MAG: hypothetical protein NT170_03935 [Candidatus Moranbacteria bacterium]|nr:hypothetical protein [Candidatus Moranbacteria bacterium]
MCYAEELEKSSEVVINVTYDPKNPEYEGAAKKLLQRPDLKVIESKSGKIRFSVTPAVEDKVYRKRAWEAAEEKISSSASR